MDVDQSSNAEQETNEATDTNNIENDAQNNQENDVENNQENDVENKQENEEKADIEQEVSSTEQQPQQIVPQQIVPPQIKVETKPKNSNKQQKQIKPLSRTFNPDEIKLNNKHKLSSKRPASAKKKGSISTAATHQLYKQCLMLQKEKERKYEERLRLENRVSMLKKELAKAFRQKAREDRKKQELKLIHKEQIETKKSLENARKEREKEILKNRRKFAKRNDSDIKRLHDRKRQSFDYKKQLAQNARFQSKIREKVARKHAQQEHHRKVTLRNKVKSSEKDMGYKKNQHLEKMLSKLAAEYQARADREEVDIQKEVKEVTDLNDKIHVLTSMISEMQQNGKLPNHAVPVNDA